MDTFFKIINLVLPAIVGGLFSFFITKYTYNRNIPLEKMEIAYNRVYYPLQRLLLNSENGNDINCFIEKSKTYFKRYEKYINPSTQRLYENLCSQKSPREKESIYKQIKDNVRNYSAFLRKRLGYLEPNILESYKYADNPTKTAIRLFFEVGLLYIFLAIASLVKKWVNIYNSFAMLTMVAFFTIIVELTVYCFKRMYYKKK